MVESNTLTKSRKSSNCSFLEFVKLYSFLWTKQLEMMCKNIHKSQNNRKQYTKTSRKRTVCSNTQNLTLGRSPGKSGWFNCGFWRFSVRYKKQQPKTKHLLVVRQNMQKYNLNRCNLMVETIYLEQWRVKELEGNTESVSKGRGDLWKNYNIFNFTTCSSFVILWYSNGDNTTKYIF